MAELDYKKAGVDVSKASRLVEQIATLASSTHRTQPGRVLDRIGGYASLFALNSKQALAASTDGVGTKLKLAFDLGVHGTVGHDLVAMSINDLLCVGARPLFFLDYFATGGLKLEVAHEVVNGISEGCKLAGCALVGGETAEMPGFYQPGEYDLAGFAVGIVDRKKILPHKKLKAGMDLIGIASSGCHSNGYSLLRKWLKDGDKNRARELLTPTRIYAKALEKLFDKNLVEACAHITGSGFLNVPRMGKQVGYEIQMPHPRELAPIYGWVREVSGLALDSLFRTFNMGLGMILVVQPQNRARVLASLKKSDEMAWVVGQTIADRSGKGFVRIHTDGKTVELVGSKT